MWPLPSLPCGRCNDVRLRLLADQRSLPDDIARLRVRAANGELVPLSSLVTYEERPVLQAITRKDRERAISFFANIAPGHDQQEVLGFVETLEYHLLGCLCRDAAGVLRSGFNHNEIPYLSIRLKTLGVV
jgi:hypothetical protein